MTRPIPGPASGQAGCHRPPVEPPPAGASAPVTLVMSREVRAGHEEAFEDVLHRLAAEAARQPGHLDVTVLRPPPGGRRIYTIVSHFASRAEAATWLASPARARLVAEAGLHADGELRTRYVSGLEGWLAAPGVPVLVPPAGWKTALVSAAGILPLLEAVSYLLAPRLAGLAVWARPLVSVVIVIPLMQYAAMPLLARAARLFLYPARASQH
jgi:antibiotic biosynthesis monooxygenase (ABM) superfamily enzyme